MRIAPLMMASWIIACGIPAGAQENADAKACASLDWDARIAGCTRWLNSNSRAPAATRANACANRGFGYQQKGDYDRAIAEFDQAIRLLPQTDTLTLAITFNNRANSWSLKGDFDRAIVDRDEAIRLNPREANFYTSRAGTWREKGDFDRALADYDKATRLNPKLPTPYIGRGLVWRIRGDLDRAIAEYNEAIRRAPKMASAYAMRGLAYESKGDYARAQADFRNAIALPGNSPVPAAKLPGKAHLVDVLASRFQGIARTRLALLSPEASTVNATATPSPAASSTTTLDRRIALVIGNGAYPAGKLRNPPNDARVVAKALREIGFEVREGIDLDRAGIDRFVREFLLDAANARFTLLFYAGHGVQIDGRNFLVPVDAKVTAGEILTVEMTALDTILVGLDDQIRRTNIVILDACRDNPLAEKEVAQAAGRSFVVRSGLAAPSDLGRGATLGAGTLIAFAAAPGQVALDGDGANSPFTTALVRHIPTPGLEVQAMLTRVRAEVVAATKSKQVPWSNSSLLGEVYLVGSKQ